MEIDLTNAQNPESYSDESLGKAREVLETHRLYIAEGSSTAQVRSLRSDEVYYPAAVRDEDATEVLGVTCTCPNGRKGGLRARCYHAAALEIALGHLE